MLTRRGQSIIEYTIVIGIVTVALYYMGTGIKRGVQMLVKVTADQVGNQENSDQDFNDDQQGYMENSTSLMQETNNKMVQETGYINASGTSLYLSNTAYNDSTYTSANTITNGGFTPNQPGQ
jgi:sulfur relay (sulfurtransferase) DsrC/TusE family protein